MDRDEFLDRLKDIIAMAEQTNMEIKDICSDLDDLICEVDF